ncbi:MAG: glycerol-3-phosphate 1-O-acyltransferase PlsY [Candidatus Eremiobacteraeota bacterium]|nr:glycerol-3-phosphate 1-O-acyltransferase PlsY [Candidatus Eremiobacteraeota bacterium]
MSDIGLSKSVADALLAILIAIPIVCFVAAFLIGSIPFGYVIGRIFYRTDIRSQGSGNIGAMNALRTLGKGGAVAVLLLDALKGFLPTVFVFWFVKRNHLDLSIDPDFPPGEQILASLVATGTILGHCFSPWLHFRGGKGVATSFGAIFALSWPAGLVATGGWLLGATLTRYSSVGSMLGSIAAPFAIWVCTGSLPETAYGIFAALLILFKHRENIRRLQAGTEGPIRLSKRQT